MPKQQIASCAENWAWREDLGPCSSTIHVERSVEERQSRSKRMRTAATLAPNGNATPNSILPKSSCEILKDVNKAAVDKGVEIVSWE